MNPLDNQELNHFIKIIGNDMPFHTSTFGKVKQSYSQGMPKNMVEHSIKINNKFLDNNLHIIEEINHRDPKNHISRSIKNYQNKIYGDSGILDHDLFFIHEGKKYAKISGGAFQAGNMATFSFAEFNRVKGNGSDIFSGNNSTTEGGNFTGFIWYNKSTGGTAGYLYNRIAVSMTVANGNNRLAAYSDSASHPLTLQQETGSVAGDTSFTWRSITEFQLPTSIMWFALQVDNTTNTIHTATGDGLRETESKVYGAYPATATPSVSGSSMYMKLGHS